MIKMPLFARLLSVAIVLGTILFPAWNTDAEIERENLPVPVTLKMKQFAADVKAGNLPALISYFDSHHIDEYIKISERTIDRNSPEFINTYVIETIGLWGENAVSSLGEIASIVYDRVDNEPGDTYTVRFTAVLKSGRRVRGMFFVHKKTALFSGPYG